MPGISGPGGHQLVFDLGVTGPVGWPTGAGALRYLVIDMEYFAEKPQPVDAAAQVKAGNGLIGFRETEPGDRDFCVRDKCAVLIVLGRVGTKRNARDQR